MAYRPKLPFTAALELLTPTVESVGGVRRRIWPESGPVIFASFQTYGGTRSAEKDVNGLYSVEDTAVVETWFRPDIKSGCAVKIAAGPSAGAMYEIVGEPENIELRNQFLRLNVTRVKGKA